jgi:hypothetical protein
MALINIDGTAAIFWSNLANDTAFQSTALSGISSLVFYVTAEGNLDHPIITGTASLIFQAQGGAIRPVKLPPWTLVPGPDTGDTYEWRLPNNGDQHGEQTVGPGDLLIKPSKLELVPTNSPKRSGVQHGQDDWDTRTVPCPSWYVAGDTVAGLAGGWDNVPGPSKTDTYEWRLPSNEDQHGEQTVGPGDLLIKPSKLALVPTNSPKREGVQHGQVDWTYTNIPDNRWYVMGDTLLAPPIDWSDVEGPSKTDTYEWRLPNNGDQHGEQTAAPGDLLIKPSKLELVPTNSPKRSGVQHGQDDWTFESNEPSSSWYLATIEDC